MKSKNTIRREEGMALLFALGFLAMLLVLGLGFVTTSLLSQKLAANNATRVQARMLARSAAARAAMYIMLYNDQSIVNEITLDDYSSVASYDKVSYKDGTNAAATGALNDQLKGTDANPAESKLNYKLVSNDDASENFFSSGQSFGAKWIYFYDSPSGTEGRKIIGRAAFQVLPGVKSLSLYRVTGNKNIGNELGVKPFDFRWGRDTDELRLDNTRTLPNWSTDGLAGSSTNAPYTYDGLYTAYSDFFPSESAADLEATAKKKKWIEYWFTEGKSPISREVYSALDGSRVRYYHRFNIGDYYTDGTEPANDNWYDRFKTPRGGGEPGYTKKNTNDALNDLTSGCVEARDDDADDAQLDNFGLPFLRRIGNDSHSFSSLELLRKQIAANLNDYCDNDSIPTSDKAADTWSVTDRTKFPNYTGNERTLYINEIALKLSDFKADFSAATLDKTVTGTNRSKVEITSITPTAIAELVNMYDNTDTDAHRDAALLNPANYKLHLALNKLTFTIGVKATFKVRYLYTSGSNTGLSGEVDVTVDYSDNATATVDYAPASPAAKEISGFNALSAGYSTGSVALDALNSTSASITQPDESIFVNKIQTAVSNALSSTGALLENYTSITVTSIGCRIKTDSAKIGFSNLLLENTLTGIGKVDYVRMADAGNMTLTGGPIDFTDASVSGADHTFAGPLFVGGIEARDPRQNLNPKFSATDAAVAEKSDWNLCPTIVRIDTDGAKTIPSMTIGSGSVTGGLKNRYADPHAPQYLKADGTTVDCTADQCDVESATDPAWKGDSAGQHVSTAYIRNEPMVSPWELGLIHRGREWQTLNLKSAGNFGGTGNIALSDIKPTYSWTDSGTTYQKGDGAILEFVKLTPLCRTMGKIPLKSLRENVIKSASPTPEWNGVDETYNKDIVKMLFDGVRVGQTMKQFYEETKFGTPTQQGGTAVSSDDALLTEFVTAVDSISDLKMRSQLLNTEYGYYKDGTDDLFTFDLVTKTNDALREELIGKTINLLAAEQNTPPNIFKVIVVAQTIHDVGGIDSDVTISKLHNGTATDLECRLGRFDFISDATDWENNTYYDEITGEVKALVTIERVPADDDKNYGRMIIRKIEYID